MGLREAILMGCGTLATLLAACASTSVASDIVGGKPAQLKARVQPGAIHITGDYSGPSALFVISACTLLYFLGRINSA